MWQHQHTFAHHSHTNEFDHDPDLHHFHLFLRVHRNVRQQSYYHNQRVWPYVMLAYMFVVFGTCVWIPLDVIQTGFLYGIVECTDRHRPWRALMMILHFMTYVGFVVILPLVKAPSIGWGILCALVHMATSGWLFGIFSQINHLSGDCLDADAITRRQLQQHVQYDDNNNNKATPSTDDRNVTIHSWAAAQVETSNNFAPQSWLWHILSNGLNLQIEHHLFPSVNHSHLHIIAPIVEQTCHEFGVKYKCFRSWSEVMRSTLAWLDQLAPETLTKE
jgi:fatty acid desaturase